MKSNIELIIEIFNLKVIHNLSDMDILDTFMALADNKLLEDVLNFIKIDLEDKKYNNKINELQ